MKKQSKTYFALMLLLPLLWSCNSFLEEYSQDERVPKDVNEYSEILYGEAYFHDKILPHFYLDLMTDDVKADVQLRNMTGTDTRQDAFGYFTWQEDPEQTHDGALRSDRTWETFYHHILTANIILDAMDEMTGEPSKKAFLKGEAHAVRLNAYFMLVNIYAPHYDATTASTTLGVPINDKAHAEDAQFPRATIQEIYQLMEADLDASLKAFSASTERPSIFRWNEQAVAILGSRLYLYKKDYERTIQLANRALAINPTFYDLNKKQANEKTSAKPFYNADNNEIAYTFGFWQPAFFSSANIAFFGPSSELLSLFTKGDQRYFDNEGVFISREQKGNFFSGRYYVTSITKAGMVEDTQVYGSAIRNTEALLNRAEAYAEMGNIEDAKRDLTALARVRYQPEHLPSYDATTKEEMIQLVRTERRKELLFERHRWFDLRRWEQPAIQHEYITDLEEGTVEVYELKERDPRYTLPIPQEVRLSDAALTQ